MKKSKNIYYIICSPDLNSCPPLSYLIVSDLTERTFLSGWEMHVHLMHPPLPAYTPAEYYLLAFLSWLLCCCYPILSIKHNLSDYLHIKMIVIY